MDLSKLPKMSDTRRGEARRRDEMQGAPDAPPADPSAASAPGRAPGMDYEPRVVAVDPGSGGGWISLIVGILLIVFMPRFWQWVFHKLTGSSFTWTFSDASGAPLAYTQSVYFLGDLALALMAVALLLEGAVTLIAATVRPAMWVAFAVVAVATALNLVYLLYMISAGYSLQLPSTIAVLVGAFMCVQQWQQLNGPRRRYLIIEE